MEGSPKFEDTGGSRLGNIIYDMEQNGFQYVPPLRSCPPDSYVSYKKKVMSGKSHIVVHADYYILLRACARVIKVNAFVLHRCILKIEKELGCIEDRIAGILKKNLWKLKWSGKKSVISRKSGDAFVGVLQDLTQTDILCAVLVG